MERKNPIVVGHLEDNIWNLSYLIIFILIAASIRGSRLGIVDYLLWLGIGQTIILGFRFHDGRSLLRPAIRYFLCGTFVLLEIIALIMVLT